MSKTEPILDRSARFGNNFKPETGQKSERSAKTKVMGLEWRRGLSSVGARGARSVRRRRVTYGSVVGAVGGRKRVKGRKNDEPDTRSAVVRGGRLSRPQAFFDRTSPKSVDGVASAFDFRTTRRIH